MYNTCRAPVLYNYAHAKEWHDKTPPIRGNADKVRPLGSRRHWQMASIAMEGEDVVLNYYLRKVVVWHPDDSITVYLPRWCTAFEPDKLAHFLPPRVNFKWDKRRLFLSNGWCDEHMEVTDAEPVRLAATDVATHCGRITRQFKIVNLPKVFKYAKRRNVLPRIVKDKFAPFLDWVQVVTALQSKITSNEYVETRNNLFHETVGISESRWNKAMQWYQVTPWPSEESVLHRKYLFGDAVRCRENFPMGGRNSYGNVGFHRAGVTRLYEMMLAENQDQWLDALQIIAGTHGKRVWADGDVGYEVPIDYVKQYIERVVCVVHRDEVFHQVELSAGEIPSKTNLQFFSEPNRLKFFEETDNVSGISF